MFSLNGLYNKYFAMNTSVRISLLFLLLMIPQNSNSPLPVMDSWLQKDQDDGSVQQELTSSLTGGDQSFGPAHQTYQNSLVRKKKSDTIGSPSPSTGFDKTPSKNKRKRRRGASFLDHYMNRDYSSAVDDRANAMLEELPYPKTSNLRSADYLNSRFLDMLNDRGAVLRDASKRFERNSQNDDRNSKWAMCKKIKTRYAPNPFSSLALPLEYQNFDDSVPLQKEYFPEDYERAGREVRNQDYKYSNQPEGKTPQVFDEDEYYDAELSPIPEENLGFNDVDYNQIMKDHSYMHKRDDTKQAYGPNAGNAGKLMEDGYRYPDARSYTFGSNLRDLGPKIQTNPKTRDVNPANRGPNSDLVWKLSSDFQSKQLNNVVRNSQRALQEVQNFQQKYKSSDQGDNDGLKRPSRNEMLMKCDAKMGIDDKRLKREDEDEQKNMKTGTDEGGGGEYEDEEGKGHKDEEEYYEDADLSNDESGNEVQPTDELNQKYVKREAAGGSRLKNKEEQNEDESQEFELNVKNAPIENAEKLKKSSFKEGEKTKKSTTRKGVKIWDQWGKWSPCSVTCGVGRSTRWRHCIGGGCAQGEKEAQIKRCTNPACR